MIMLDDLINPFGSETRLTRRSRRDHSSARTFFVCGTYDLRYPPYKSRVNPRQAPIFVGFRANPSASAESVPGPHDTSPFH